MSALRAVRILVAKDLRSEWHSKEVLSSTVFFAVIAMTVINFSFEPGQFQADQVGAGILWTSFLFAAMLGMPDPDGNYSESPDAMAQVMDIDRCMKIVIRPDKRN